MQRKVLVGELVVGFSALSLVLSVVIPLQANAAVTQRDWIGPTSGTSLGAPATWNEPTNWKDDTPPGAKTDIANFGATPNNLFVELPSTLTLGALHQTGDGTVHLLGDKLTVDSTGWSSTAGTANIAGGRLRSKVYVWADVTAPDNFSGMWSVMGDMFVKGELTSSIGSQYWRGYLYSNSASEDRSNAFFINNLNNSSSACSFIAPPGTPARDSVGWSQTEKSALVAFVGTTIGRIAPGCRVSGPGIPEGTFLKRYYEDYKIIELSQPVTETIASNTLHFDAYHPTTTGCIKTFRPASNSNQSFQAYMPAADGTFVIYIGSFSLPAGQQVTFSCGTYPARLVISNSVDAAGTVVFRSNSDFFFTKPTSGTAGLSKVKGITFFADKTYTSGCARIGVAENVEAVYTNVTAVNSAHSVVKYGAGSLLFDLKDTLTSVSSPLTVEEGVFAISPQAASVTCQSVSISAGATFKVASGTAVISVLAAESGATIEAVAGTVVDLSALGTLPAGLHLEGEGAFVVKTLASIGNAVLGSTAEIRLTVEGEARGFKSMTPVTPAVVGEPAFWVDATKEVSLFTTSGVSVAKSEAFTYTDCVSCWRDCRYADDPARYGVYYATNDFSGIRQTVQGTAPSRRKELGGFKVIQHMGDIKLGLSGDALTNYRWVHAGMKWSQPITGIRAVFSVTWQDGSKGQAILGGTPRLGDSDRGDFARAISNATDGGGIASPDKAFLFSAVSADCVKNGWIYAEGVMKPWNECVYQNSSIEIRESHPLAPGGRADAFAIQDFGQNVNPCIGSGCQNQIETIVYTNELTMAEREQVYAYLARKYLGADNAGTTSGGSRYDGNGHVEELSVTRDLNLNVNGMMLADRVSGAGTLVKKGPGTLYADLVEGASLAVKGGQVVVHSAKTPTSYADLPADHFVHWDAANTNNMDLWTTTDAISDNFDEAGNAASGYKFSVAHTNLVRHWYDAQYGNDGQHIYGTGRKSDPAYRVGWLVTNQVNGLPAVDYGPIFNFKTGMSQSRRYFHEFHLTDKNEPIRSNPITAMFMVKNAAAGGNLVLGDTSSGYGISRTSNTADYTVPIVSSSGMAATLNGASVDPMKTGYTGGWDQLSLYCLKNSSGCLIGANTTFTISGGMKLGEVLIYTNALGWADARAVDAYLGNKWFNRTLPYAAPSSVGTLSIAAGATLTVEGGEPLTVTALGEAGGTVEGSLAFAAEATIDVTIENGAVAGVTVTGDVDFSKGGTVIVHGDVKSLLPGDYPLVSATAANFGEGTWTLDVETPHRSRVLLLRPSATGLFLGVTKSGTLLIVR